MYVINHTISYIVLIKKEMEKNNSETKEASASVIHFPSRKCANFNTLFNGNGLNTVVVYIGASWCGPCKKYKPEFYKLAETLKTHALFVHMDIDELNEKYEEDERPNEFINIDSVPTTLIFKVSRGKIVSSEKHTGFSNKTLIWISTIVLVNSGVAT